MSGFLAVPLKKPSEVDIVKPLNHLIQARYSTADKPEDCSLAISELSKLRNNAVWKSFEKYESSLDVIYRYYDQLVALETKIPPSEVQIPFKWKDAFDKGSLFLPRMSLTISSLSFERVCVLFNIGALQSWIAANQSLDSDEGLKLATKLFQQSASVFNLLKATVMSVIQQDPTPDLNPDTLSAISSLMLAQAQEMFVHKAIHDKMKDQIVAKLSAQCEELYNECWKTFQRENLKHIWEKEWLPLIAGKQDFFAATAEFYQSLLCNEIDQIGEKIPRLTKAVKLFKQAQQKFELISVSTATTNHTSLLKTLEDKAQQNLEVAKKDNDFIYHKRILEVKSLAPIDKVQLAKLQQLSSPMSANFQDLFTELVPVAVHQALAAYDVRKNDIVNTEIGRLREATTLLNGVLASLNLPAAIETTNSGDSLPPSLLEKAQSVVELGGITTLDSMLNELPEALRRNEDILNEADRLLDEEKHADDKLRQELKERWTRTASVKLTEMFRSNSQKYRQIIETARGADRSVREKFEKHRNGIALLSKSAEDLQAAVPKNGSSSGGGRNLENSSAVAELKKLMTDVETIKVERDVIESELKDGATFDMQATFMKALAKDGAINEAPMSVESLGKTFGPLQKQVRESVDRQAALIDLIRKAHSMFIKERGSTATASREATMVQLAAAHDAFIELHNNLKEGSKFYNDLTVMLIAFQNKISDYCFARKTEKDELLKDISQEKSRQAPAPIPATPSYYGSTPLGAPLQDSKQQQPATNPNIPYPMYAQTMPMPYGPSGTLPYPAYALPPMPHGYNPYGSLPYPSGYNYPGGFPQGYPGQQTGNSQPQQPPPGGYPH